VDSQILDFVGIYSVVAEMNEWTDMTDLL